MPHDERGAFFWVETPDEVVHELRTRGLEPLHNYTGIVEELGSLWPADCASDVREMGHPNVDPDIAWYVRSPWVAIGLREVIRLLWYWADRTQDNWEVRARDFLSLSPERVTVFQREHPTTPS